MRNPKQKKVNLPGKYTLEIVFAIAFAFAVGMIMAM